MVQIIAAAKHAMGAMQKLRNDGYLKLHLLSTLFMFDAFIRHYKAPIGPREMKLVEGGVSTTSFSYLI